MGSIIGGIASGVGAAIGGEAEANAAEHAADIAQTGYKYLTQGPGAAAASNYINTGSNALTAQAGTQGAIAGLLGQGPNSAANKAAFNNYLGSTGYQFQLGQGTGAIDANAASRGLLDSGANAKALAGYGQNLASTTFNNYLSQLGGLNAAQGATAAQGESMLSSIGSIGTAAGGNAANATIQGGQAQGNMWGGLGGAIGNMFGGLGGGSGGYAFTGNVNVPAGGLSTG